MPLTATLPDQPGEITPEWLSSVLSGAEDTIRAESVQVIESHSGTTGRTRLRVEWANGTPLPPEIFVKLPPTDPTSRHMVITTGMGKREAIFYHELGKEVPVRIPRPFWSGWNEEGSAYVMLMEDLATSGCRFPSPRDPELVDHAQSLMRGLGSLHAFYWNSPRFADDLSWVEPTMRNEWGPKLIESGLEQFGDEMPDLFCRLARLYLAQHDALNDVLDQGPHTLIHGDCHIGNLFVDGQKVGFLDWACFSHAPGMRDVAYFLCNSLPTRIRQSEQENLLEIYRESLAQSGGPTVSRESIWEDYRRFAAYSWISAVTTAAAGARMQSLAIGQAAMQRTQAAITELDTLSLFESALGVSS